MEEQMEIYPDFHIGDFDEILSEWDHETFSEIIQELEGLTIAEGGASFIMASLIADAVKSYDDLMLRADPRVADWFMMSTPWPSFLICVLYVVIIKMGPTLMGNRPPLELKKVMLVYNFCMIILSAYCFIEFAASGWMAGYSLGCQPVDYSNSPQAVRMAKVCWMFYISKFIELLDTIFFILRKKYNQASFLHVFHHGIMPFSWWFGVKFVPGGFGTFHSLLNSFIHFMMYTYYFLAALGPAFQRFLWWKKYMTSMQLTQFILVVIHSTQLLFRECDYPVLFIYWIGAYAGIFLILFADFYRKAYIKPKPKSEKFENGSVKRNGLKKER